MDYNLINQAEAEQMIARGQFIEAKFVHGTVYGTSVAALEEIS